MVTGVEQLRQRLTNEIPKKMRAELAATMIASANRIVGGARLRVPVETGKVRDSIKRTGVREGKRGGLYIAVIAGDQSTQTDESGNIYQVARLLEFGTQKMHAQPYLLPAYRANRASAKRGIRKAIRDSLIRK